MKTKRVAIYVRVSTTEQDTEGQETELWEYIDRRGWNYEVYRDKGQSGAKSDRPELTRLLADLRRRKLDIVVVWALDRLARSLRQLLEIAEQCQSLGVDLVSLRQNIDTTLPAGRLTFQILGAVAEFEREMLRERVKAGMAQARRTGKRMGRPALRCFNPSDVERWRAGLDDSNAAVGEDLLRMWRHAGPSLFERLCDRCGKERTPKHRVEWIMRKVDNETAVE